MKHQPVMIKESLEGLCIKPGGIYIDGTFGRGGHARAILEELNDDGRLIAIDKDPEAIQVAKILSEEDSRFTCCHGSFNEMHTIADKLDILGKVDGILLDLGISSPQLDTPDRGFSFMRDGPLDMRMDPEVGITASEWLAEASMEDIAEILHVYGEERFAKRIAKSIVEARKKKPILRTSELVDIILRVYPRYKKDGLKKHPATRTFQALRIHINQELSVLEETLPLALNILKPRGRLVIISFHSLEDRIVKQFIAKEVNVDNHPLKLPLRQSELAHPNLKKIGKFKPMLKETRENPRARSAMMRVAEKCNFEGEAIEII